MSKELSKISLVEKFSEAAATKNGLVHIIPGKAGWSVKKAGAKRATVVKTTKESAVKAANKIKLTKSVIIHEKAGGIK